MLRFGRIPRIFKQTYLMVGQNKFHRPDFGRRISPPFILFISGDHRPTPDIYWVYVTIQIPLCHILTFFVAYNTASASWLGHMPPGLQIITIQNWGSLELEILHEFRGLEKPWCFATALALDLPCVELGNLTHISCQWLWVQWPIYLISSGKPPVCFRCFLVRNQPF